MTLQWVHDDEITVDGTAGYLHTVAQQFRQNEVAVPHAFVIDDGVFRRLLEHNELRQRLEEILSHSGEETQIATRIQQLLMHASFAPEDKQALLQAYQRIGMADEVRRAGDEALELVSGREQQPVTLVANDFVLDMTPKQWNARGQTGFMEAIIALYAAFFSAELLLALGRRQLERDFSIVVQTFSVPDQYCIVYTQDPRDLAETLVVESAYGLPPIFETEQADLHIVDKETGEIEHEYVAPKHIQYAIDGLYGTMKPESVPAEQQEQHAMDMQLLSKVLHLALKIESSCGVAIRAELAIEKGQPTLVDISRVMPVSDTEKRRFDGEYIAHGIGAAYGTVSGQLVSWEQFDMVQDDIQSAIVSVPRPQNTMRGTLLTAHGIICEYGSLSSTTAQLARHMCIPMLIHTTFTEDVGTDSVYVDAFQGVVQRSVPQHSQAQTYAPTYSASTASSPDILTGTTILVTEPTVLDAADGCLVLQETEPERIKAAMSQYSPSCVWLHMSSLPSQSFQLSCPVLSDPPISSVTQGQQSGLLLHDFASLVQCEDILPSMEYIVLSYADLLRDTRDGAEQAIVKAIQRLRSATDATLCVMLDGVDITPERIAQCLYAGADALAVHTSHLAFTRYWVAKKEQQVLVRSALAQLRRQW